MDPGKLLQLRRPCEEEDENSMEVLRKMLFVLVSEANNVAVLQCSCFRKYPWEDLFYRERTGKFLMLQRSLEEEF